MQKKRILLGIAGHPSGGKDTVADYIVEKYHFSHVSTGDYLREYMKKNNLGETTRDKMNEVVTKLREQFGIDFLVRAALEEYTTQDLVMSGIRSSAEAQAIQKAGGYVLIVDANQKTRYDRAQLRKRTGDDIDFETFKKQEEAEDAPTNPYSPNVSAVMGLADEFIHNDGTREQLFSTVDDFLDRIKKGHFKRHELSSS